MERDMYCALDWASSSLSHFFPVIGQHYGWK